MLRCGKYTDRVPAVGIAAAADRGPRFLGGVDVGHEDAVGAHVQRLLDAGAVAVAADAHHRCRAAVGDAGQHAREAFVAHRPVLRVDQQPVVAAVRQLFGNGRTVRVQEQAQFRRAAAQLLLEFRSADRCMHGDTLLLQPAAEPTVSAE